MRSFIASRQDNGRADKFVDLTRFDSLVDDLHRTVGGFFEQRLAALAKRGGLDARRPVFQDAALRIACVGEETARALYLKN